jgi:hypothetical protein
VNYGFIGILEQNVLYISGESFDMWQAVTSATSKLETLIQLLLKFNLQSQESQVESVQDLNFRSGIYIRI